MSVSRLVVLTVVAGVALSSVGCVPYQKYRDSVAKVGRVKAYNSDLIKKYNQLMAKYMSKSGSSDMNSEERAALLAEIERIKSEIHRAPQIRPGEGVWRA